MAQAQSLLCHHACPRSRAAHHSLAAFSAPSVTSGIKAIINYISAARLFRFCLQYYKTFSCILYLYWLQRHIPRNFLQTTQSSTWGGGHWISHHLPTKGKTDWFSEFPRQMQECVSWAEWPFTTSPTILLCPNHTKHHNHSLSIQALSCSKTVEVAIRNRFVQW